MKKRMTTFFIVLGGLLTFWLLIVGYNVLTGPHTELGVINGRLTPVPESPNAVSSYAADAEHGMDPIVFDGSAEHALCRVRQVVESMPRATIVVTQDNYLRAEFQSGFFRFVDDVEFLVDDETNRVHFRSASRLGHSDMGANRARMMEFQSQFEKLQQAPAAE